MATIQYLIAQLYMQSHSLLVLNTIYRYVLETQAWALGIYICIFIIGVPFPKNFMSVAKTILKRLFRVYAHIYHQHFDSVMQLQEEAHLNTSFKHFIFFVQVSWTMLTFVFFDLNILGLVTLIKNNL